MNEIKPQSLYIVAAETTKSKKYHKNVQSLKMIRFMIRG